MRPIDYDSYVHIGDLSIGEGGESIEVRTLDSLLPNGYDFIKIDVQGYEKYVLEGSLNIINNHKPIIIIEIECHQLNRFGYGCDELFNLIKGLIFILVLKIIINRKNKRYIKLNAVGLFNFKYGAFYC